MKYINTSANKFGTLVEAFEKAAKCFAEGSKDYTRYMDAKEKAQEIYKQQMLADIRNETSGMNRAEVEGMNKTLFDLAAKYEDDGTHIRGRLLWVAHMAGDWWQQQNGSVHKHPKPK